MLIHFFFLVAPIIPRPDEMGRSFREFDFKRRGAIREQKERERKNEMERKVRKGGGIKFIEEFHRNVENRSRMISVDEIFII